MRFQWRVGVATIVAATLIAASPAASQRLQATTLAGGDWPILLSLNVAPNGRQGLAGLSAPGAQILVRVEGRLVGATIADGSGAWSLTLTAPLAKGRHVVQIASRSMRDGALRHGEMTEVTVPENGSGALRELTSSEEHAIEQARSFADEATRIFDQLAPTLERGAGAGAPVPATGARAGLGLADDVAGDRSVIDVAGDWIDRAARHYQGVIMHRLAVGEASGAGGAAAGDGSGQRGSATPPRRAQVGAPEKDVLDQIVEGVRAWFGRANKDYQAVIVRHLSEPAPTETSGVLGRSRSTVAAVPRTTAPASDRRTFVEKRAEQSAAVKSAEKSLPAAPAPKASAPPPASAPQRDGIEIAQDALSGWFSRANRDYHTVIVRHLVETGGPPQTLLPRGDGPLPGPKGPPPASGGDEVAQSAEQAARLAAVERRRADEERAEQERQRQATEASRREAEQALKRSADEAAKANAAEEARRVANAQSQAEADRQRAMAADAARRAEAAKRADDERRASEDARRLAQVEAARVAAAQRIVEEQKRRIAEEDRRRADEDRRRAEEERRRAAEAERKAVAAAGEAAAAEAARESAGRRPAERAVRTEAAAGAKTRRPAEQAVRGTRAYAKVAPPRVAAGRAVLRTAAAGNVSRPAPSAVRARVLRSATCPNARVVVVETRTGIYNSVFNKEVDQRRVVVAYNSPMASNALGCQTVAQRE